jgi:hypothetical protein
VSRLTKLCETGSNPADRNVTIASKSPAETEMHYRSYRSVGSKFVSAGSLPKTGVSAVLAGDFSDILAEVVIFLRPETNRKRAKSSTNAAFLLKMRSPSLVERVAGWSERIRTHAFLIEPRLCATFAAFGN